MSGGRRCRARTSRRAGASSWGHSTTGAAYNADRTGALAGVPKWTVHYWAGGEILIPGVSRERVKLWSFTDLMALRMIDWLRRDKTSPEGKVIAATTMRAIRRALK